MSRQSLRFVTNWFAVAVGSCLVIAGCQTPRSSASRSPSVDEAVDARPEAGSNEPRDVQSPKQGFFKSSRLPGAMSDEGREIEKDLGIH